ncbi:hypothetical protein Patl_1082 [Paraglaciecola sp. T6c]|uniref:hypothetical protein n=1 Tax=Pseudoalteromonas atlantica (strain T6c / ATCC BAA-1087) TaxID=3042615 RepID=UPI00005C5CA8|nr:hypothetical protein [Paraglaciecola sp. T6c]ABG39608.1 hypothetical protein Patl_1082 [Paraglaciecola sp. T6c]
MKVKTLVKHICIFATLLLCHSTNASIIKKNDFSLDTSTNIITGNGLNWTRWDTLAGVSINQALGLYAADGWRLASSDEIIGMYSHFLSGVNWSMAQGENSGVNDFISVDDYKDLITIFGVSFNEFGGMSNIIFGNDVDNDGAFRSAGAYYTDWDPAAGIYPDSRRLTVDFSSGYYSVQLVRAINVSEPKQICFFMLSLLLLLATKYRKAIR